MSIHQVRVELVTTLQSLDAQVYDHLPARLSPPAVVILPGSPYLEPSDRAASFLAHHTVTVIVPAGASDVVTRTIDDLLEDVLVELINAKYLVDSVSTFYGLDLGGTSFLAADVFVHRTITL